GPIINTNGASAAPFSFRNRIVPIRFIASDPVKRATRRPAPPPSSFPVWLTDKLRHETLQRFMLSNDSVTMAIEVPIWLTAEDIAVVEDEHRVELTQRDDPAKRARNYRPHRFPVGVERGRAYPRICLKFKADGSSYRRINRLADAVSKAEYRGLDRSHLHVTETSD